MLGSVNTEQGQITTRSLSLVPQTKCWLESNGLAVYGGGHTSEVVKIVSINSDVLMYQALLVLVLDSKFYHIFRGLSDVLRTFKSAGQ